MLFTLLSIDPTPPPVEVFIETPPPAFSLGDTGALVAALLALAGAIFTSWNSGKNMIMAENIRHENEVSRATRDHMLDIVRDTYVQLEAGRRDLYQTAVIIELELYTEDVIPDRLIEFLDQLMSAQKVYSPALSSVNLVGSVRVSTSAQHAENQAFLLHALLDPNVQIEDPGLEQSHQGIREQANKLRKSCERLLSEMRSELHPDQSDESRNMEASREAGITGSGS